MLIKLTLQCPLLPAPTPFLPKELPFPLCPSPSFSFISDLVLKQAILCSPGWPQVHRDLTASYMLASNASQSYTVRTLSQKKGGASIVYVCGVYVCVGVCL